MRKFLGIASLLLLFSALRAQPVSDDLPQVTGCIALINANVVSSAGKSLQVSDIVIRDGLITQIGSNIKIPPDAYRIPADSFYVYPAFIDAFSSISLKEEEEDNRTRIPGPDGRGSRPSVDAEGNPSLENAGITPFAGIRSSIDIKSKSITDWRALGFAIAHVVPTGKMIPGKGSVILLDGKDADQLLWREDISMFAQWVGAGGNYPGTVIGMMAKWRELYENASHNVIHQASYNQGAAVTRPDYNQAHEALQPVVKKEMPVYFRAPKVKDISRALALQEDLGMNMVIADAEEAWYLKEKFKSGLIPLILSLDLPDDKSEDAKAKGEKPSSVPKADSTKIIEGEKPVQDPEKIAFEKRRSESLKEHRSQAAILSKSGVPFSFGTKSTKPADFSKNLQLILEHGLTPDQALHALTVQPAKVLGIDKYCGTIEQGKMANMIIANKPVFEKDAEIRYMIVEGNLYEYDAKEKKKKTDNASKEIAAALVGKWNYTIETPVQEKTGFFEFSEKDGEITGTITSEEITSGNHELEHIVIDSNNVAFTYDHDIGGEKVKLEFDLTLKEESFEGTVSTGSTGTYPIRGERIEKPQNKK